MNNSQIDSVKLELMPNSELKADAYSVSPSIAKPLVGGWACQVCGLSSGKPALKTNNVEVGHCCLPFIKNLSKNNGNTFLQELENQTNYINSLN
jgi:hypothetical protein